MLRTNYEDEWNNLLGNLKPNDPKLFRTAKGLVRKQKASEPLLGPNGLVLDPVTKTQLFANTLESQFTCPTGTNSTTQMVNEKL